MDESRFRALMHEAIGDEPIRPWLTAAVRDRLTTPERHRIRRRWAYLIAAALVVLVVAGFVAPRLLGFGSNTISPAATPSPVVTPSPAYVDPFQCTLPLVDPGGAVGFFDTYTGEYRMDASASVAGLPSDGLNPAMPTYYSPALRRWLPISAFEISPDGRSYAWLRLLPQGSTRNTFKTVELHRYDVATATDVTLWTFTNFIYVLRWDSVGIRVSTQPPGWHIPRGTSWLVDPVSGVATQEVPPSPASNFPFTPLPGDPQGTDGTGFRSVGVDAEGRTIWWFGNPDKPGAVDWVFYETAPGQRVFIYRGTQLDMTRFDPDSVMADSTGLWFTDHSHGTMWHWDHPGDLYRAPIAGSPFFFGGPCF